MPHKSLHICVNYLKSPVQNGLFKRRGEWKSRHVEKNTPFERNKVARDMKSLEMCSTMSCLVHLIVVHCKLATESSSSSFLYVLHPLLQSNTLRLKSFRVAFPDYNILLKNRFQTKVDVAIILNTIRCCSVSLHYVYHSTGTSSAAAAVLVRSLRYRAT